MDIEILLAPLEGDNPSGVELRNEAQFHAIERLLESAAKSVRVSTDIVLNPSATAVEWDDITSTGMELAAIGRDVRLLVIMVRTAFAEDGFEGLVAGLGLLHDTLDQHWDTMHPELRDRPSPRDAATPRVNALKQLENDNNGLLGDMKYSVLLNPRGIGPILGYDLSVATLTASDVQAQYSGLSQAELAEIGAKHEARANKTIAATRAMAAEEADKAEAMVATIIQAEAAITTLCAKLSEKGGFGDEPGLSLPETSEFLAKVRRTLEKAMSETDAPADAPTPSAAPTASSPAPTSAPAGNGFAAVAGINSRADVEASLDSIIAFYERTEPSSPIPHLAHRMRRMVQMDFLELMEEIAPSGMKEFRNIAGVEDARKK